MDTDGDNDRDNAQSPGSQNDLSPTQEMAQSCLGIVEQRGKSSITTTEVILSVLKTLPEEGSIQAFMWYVDQLTEIKQDQAVALE